MELRLLEQKNTVKERGISLRMGRNFTFLEGDEETRNALGDMEEFLWRLNEKREQVLRCVERGDALTIERDDGYRLVFFSNRKGEEQLHLELLNPPGQKEEQILSNAGRLYAYYDRIFVSQSPLKEEMVVETTHGRFQVEEIPYSGVSLLALRKMPAKITITTFGKFSMWVDERPVEFTRDKSRELLALLVDRRGEMTDRRELWGILWPEEPIEETLNQRFRTEWKALKNLLEWYGAEWILGKSHRYRFLASVQVDCDYFRLLDGERRALCTYDDNYMEEYDWAKERREQLQRTVKKYSLL